MTNILFWSSLAMLGVATVCGWFPLWRSATLSPDSIQRRSYWTGTALGIVLLVLSQFPDWKSAAIISVGLTVGMVVIAMRWTRHVKILAGSLPSARVTAVLTGHLLSATRNVSKP